MSDVIRGKKSGLNPLILAGYGVHGVFAVLVLWRAMAFHAVTTGLGTFCIGRGVGRRPAVSV